MANIREAIANIGEVMNNVSGAFAGVRRHGQCQESDGQCLMASARPRMVPGKYIEI
ncbi:hypothetical protein [Advenella sp. S44]|uniref:hypothetical protein n=1 Tax=Advenella sp. S44 TaxID=1982755 RepID=UPI0013747AB0|nr:hypothetical protein [Advenella sp. S44]